MAINSLDDYYLYLELGIINSSAELKIELSKFDEYKQRPHDKNVMSAVDFLKNYNAFCENNFLQLDEESFKLYRDQKVDEAVYNKLKDEFSKASAEVEKIKAEITHLTNIRDKLIDDDNKKLDQIHEEENPYLNLQADEKKPTNEIAERYQQRDEKIDSIVSGLQKSINEYNKAIVAKQDLLKAKLGDGISPGNLDQISHQLNQLTVQLSIKKMERIKKLLKLQHLQHIEHLDIQAKKIRTDFIDKLPTYLESYRSDFLIKKTMLHEKNKKILKHEIKIQGQLIRNNIIIMIASVPLMFIGIGIYSFYKGFQQYKNAKEKINALRSQKSLEKENFSKNIPNVKVLTTEINEQCINVESTKNYLSLGKNLGLASEVEEAFTTNEGLIEQADKFFKTEQPIASKDINFEQFTQAIVPANIRNALSKSKVYTKSRSEENFETLKQQAFEHLARIINDQCWDNNQLKLPLSEGIKEMRKIIKDPDNPDIGNKLMKLNKLAETRTGIDIAKKYLPEQAVYAGIKKLELLSGYTTMNRPDFNIADTKTLSQQVKALNDLHSSLLAALTVSSKTTQRPR